MRNNSSVIVVFPYRHAKYIGNLFEKSARFARHNYAPSTRGLKHPLMDPGEDKPRYESTISHFGV